MIKLGWMVHGLIYSSYIIIIIIFTPNVVRLILVLLTKFNWWIFFSRKEQDPWFTKNVKDMKTIVSHPTVYINLNVSVTTDT